MAVPIVFVVGQIDSVIHGNIRAILQFSLPRIVYDPNLDLILVSSTDLSFLHLPTGHS